MTQIIVVQSFAASGATTIALNIALTILQLWPEKKVRLITCGKHNAVIGYCAQNVQNNEGGYLFSRLDISENTHGDDAYDYTIVDLDRSSSDEDQKAWHEKMDLHIQVVSKTPNIERFLGEAESFPSPSLLIENKASLYTKKSVFKADAMLPYCPGVFWKETFLGIPVSHQASSRWSRALKKFVIQYILHA